LETEDYFKRQDEKTGLNLKDSDHKLIEKFKSGDHRSFEVLIQKYNEKVLLLSYDILDSYEDAKDVAQEVFIRVYNSIQGFRGDSKFSTWLYRITMNLSISYWRKKNRSREMIVDDEIWQRLSLNSAEKSIDQEVENQEFNKKLYQLMNLLSDHQRTAFILRHYHGLTTDEISEVMECKGSTVRVHLFRALQKIKDELRIYMNR